MVKKELLMDESQRRKTPEISDEALSASEQPDQSRHAGHVLIDPPIVAAGRKRAGKAKPNLSWVEDLSGWLETRFGVEGYGAPRVFDLFTLMAVTLAFALLFALLRLLQPAFGGDLGGIAFAISGFVTLTALAQMLLFKGNKPRLSSILAGPVVWLVVGITFSLIAAPRDRVAASIGVICSTFVGLPAGYLGGAMVAGVFLLADQFRRRFMNSPSEDPVNDDAIWNDDSEPE